MSGRFPGARSPAELWNVLAAGTDTITHFDEAALREAGVSQELLDDARYVRARGILEDVDRFDAKRFSLTDSEAAAMDPQQRVFLECCLEALEMAGCDPGRTDARIGVFAGARRSTYGAVGANPATTPMGQATERLTHDPDFLTALVSYKLDLTGPSMSVQTACSTSLVAVHQACQALLAGDADLALAGGVSITLPQERGYLYQAGGIASADGRCRPFDRAADGTVTASGAGVVTLERLDDALSRGRTILAVIRGSAVNNDGARRVGFTAPGYAGQVAVIRDALAVAGVAPSSISYVETHGTATTLGDAIEVAALTEALEAAGDGPPCGLGALKSNLGHLDAAAGVAGLIKVVLALQHQQIPATLHHTQPHPDLDLAGTRFRVNTEHLDWNTGATRRAGVSAFGVGGTNAHVIVEEAPRLPDRDAPAQSAPEVLVLSASDDDALSATAQRLSAHLTAHPDLRLGDVARTLQEGRTALPHRLAVVTPSAADAATRLRSPISGSIALNRTPSVAFLLPGQGAEHPAMGAGLRGRHPVFEREYGACAAALAPRLGLDLRDPLLGDGAALADTRVAQPALFAFEYALSRQWQSMGLEPAALLGHSLGELAAACLAGVFDRDGGLSLACTRGQLMHDLAPGAMLAVRLSEAELRERLPPELDVAAINGPRLCVVAGPHAGVDAFADRLDRERVAYRAVRRDHAFHSALCEPMLERYREAIVAQRRSAPTHPIVSGVTGTWLTDAEAVDPDHWVRQVRDPVRYWNALGTLAQRCDVLLEVGPGRTLTGFAAEHPSHPGRIRAVASLGGPRDEHAAMLAALGNLWTAGVPVDWAAHRADKTARLLPLPTYPLRRQRCWIDLAAAEPAPLRRQTANGRARSDAVVSASTVEAGVAEVWQELFGGQPVGSEDNFFALGGNSLLAFSMIARLEERFGREVALREIFDAPTVAGVAAALVRSSATSTPPVRATTTDLPAAPATPPLHRGLQLGLMFFSANDHGSGTEPYQLVLDCARFADRHGFSAVWTPERHFEEFGGSYPNPSLLSAALSMVTERIHLRAGSVVLPLHHSVRVAEEWAAVDRLSGGRVGLSVATGWHPRDFVLARRAHAERRDAAIQTLRELRALWAGEAVAFPTPNGDTHEVRVLPRPVQPQLPLWWSIAGNPVTWDLAGELGVNVLTGFANQPIAELTAKIARYRAARAQHGHDPEAGTVTVMVHTFIGPSDHEVAARVATPMRTYLRSFLAQHRDGPAGQGNPRNTEDAIDMALARYLDGQALFGSEATCLTRARQLAAAGVDELACLMDFGLPAGEVLGALPALARVRDLLATPT